LAAEYALFFGILLVARAGVLVAFALTAGAAATVCAAVICGDTITALAAIASDTAIFVKQICFAIEELIGL
jgi:hypothetical protein